jgi:hypothetical protein
VVHGACLQRSRIAEVPEVCVSLARQRRNFFLYGALLKYSRITEAEIIYSVAGILAMQCCLPFLKSFY